MSFELVAPRTPEEAFRLLGEGAGAASVLAGGTDLLFDLDRVTTAPRRVVSLRHLPWRGHAWQGDTLVVGSTEPLHELERDGSVAARLPGLHTAIRAVGSRALRHRATLGGNLARAAPASDLLPILLALDATVEIAGPAGTRRMDLDSFLVASRTTALRPPELIRSVAVPAAPSVYLWQRVRPANDISQVGVAIAHPGRAVYRIAVGGIVPRPRRLRGAESGLVSDPPPGPERVRAAEEAAREAPFPSDRRATEEHRRRVVRALVERGLVHLAGGAA